MNFYIKEWPDNTATLMTERGHIIWIFPSVEEAAEAAADGPVLSRRRDQKPEKNEITTAGGA
jgi:hypothetical protein